MKLRPIFSRDNRHLWILLCLILGGGTVSLVVRNALIPESFGRLGPYRADALGEIAALRSTWQADATCLKCHVEVGEEREGSAHEAVSCAHCHGLGRVHVAQARLAAESKELSIDPAKKWDGDFLTTVDLYIARHRNTCLVCHRYVLGKPDDFLMIDVDEHLADVEPKNPNSPAVCLECHGAHDTTAK